MIKHGFYKTIMLSTILITSSLLGACNILDNENLTIEEISDNYYSELYYNEVNYLIDDYLNYSTIVNKKDIDDDEFLIISNDFLLKLDSYELSPKSIVDYQVDNYLVEFKYKIKKYIDFKIKYIEDDDIGAMYESDKYAKDSTVLCDVLIKTINKYEVKGD